MENKELIIKALDKAKEYILGGKDIPKEFKSIFFLSKKRNVS